MDAQVAPVPDLWLYARNVAHFVISYPYFYLFPVLTIARHSVLANSTGSEKLLASSDSPSFFTAFIFPFEPFCVWAAEQVFRGFVTAILDLYLGYFAKTIITIILCAPLKLLRTWAIVRGNRSSLQTLIDSARSIRLTSWCYYVGTLLACEAVEILVTSPAVLPFSRTAQDLGIIPQQADGATSDTGSTWILASIAGLLGSAGITVLLEWFPATVVSVRAALSLLDPGYGGGNGLWNDIQVSLRSITPSLCGKLALYYFLGMIVTVGAKVSLLVTKGVFNLISHLSKVES